MGERPEEAGELAPLSSPSPARGCGGDGPCSDPGRGNREGGERERWAGPGVGPVGPGVQWGGGPSPFFLFSLPVLFSVVFSFYLFIFFSVLFHLKVFRYFIKMCFLHHNYQCIIWHPPNIFVQIFENFYFPLLNLIEV